MKPLPEPVSEELANKLRGIERRDRLYQKTTTAILPPDRDIAAIQANRREAVAVAELIEQVWADGLWPVEAPHVVRSWLRLNTDNPNWMFEACTQGAATHVEIRVLVLADPR